MNASRQLLLGSRYIQYLPISRTGVFSEFAIAHIITSVIASCTRAHPPTHTPALGLEAAASSTETSPPQGEGKRRGTYMLPRGMVPVRGAAMREHGRGLKPCHDSPVGWTCVPWMTLLWLASAARNGVSA